MYKNLMLIGADLGVSVDTLTSMSSSAVKHHYTNVSHDWRTDLIREILSCRDGDLHSPLTDQEISLALNVLCTF